MQWFCEALSCNICMSFTHLKDIKCNLSFLLTFCFLSFHFHSCFCYSYMINDLCVLSLFFFGKCLKFFFLFSFSFFSCFSPFNVDFCSLTFFFPWMFFYLCFFIALLVEVNFNSCRIISHYCKNIFALQYVHIHNFCLDYKHIWLCNLLKHQINGYFI
jgi:hypothetical protein